MSFFGTIQFDRLHLMWRYWADEGGWYHAFLLFREWWVCHRGWYTSGLRSSNSSFHMKSAGQHDQCQEHSQLVSMILQKKKTYLFHYWTYLISYKNPTVTIQGKRKRCLKFLDSEIICGSHSSTFWYDRKKIQWIHIRQCLVQNALSWIGWNL